jgi:rsbT antagonist protein RsbS
MHDRLAMKLQNDLTEWIAATRAKGVLIDISSLEVVDSLGARPHRRNVAGARRRHGCGRHAPRSGDHARRAACRCWGFGKALDVEKGMALIQPTLARPTKLRSGSSGAAKTS